MATVHSASPTPALDFIPKTLCDPIYFGDDQFNCNVKWDNLAAFKRPSKICQIRYKVYQGNCSLIGIQLIFTNNIKTEHFQTRTGMENQSQEWKQIKVDPSKTIATVGMKINEPDQYGSIKGIKIYSDDYEELCNVTWDTKNLDGVWVYHDIPRGQQICGLAADTSYSE